MAGVYGTCRAVGVLNMGLSHLHIGYSRNFLFIDLCEEKITSFIILFCQGVL